MGKQKSTYRTDQQLAPLSTNQAELPPGFQMKQSQSRPGEYVYLDATTGVRYGSPELAWRMHFERLRKHNPAGMGTVRNLNAARMQIPLGQPCTPPSTGAANGPRASQSSGTQPYQGLSSAPYKPAAAASSGSVSNSAHAATQPASISLADLD